MTPTELKPNNSTCPRCGAGLHCGRVRRAGPPQASTGDAQCWCVQLPQVMPVPRASPTQALPDNSAASCFCPACLKQITDERQHPISPARD